MRAIVYKKYGAADVLKLDEVDEPVVDDDHVLVRIRAASLNPYDWHLLTGLPYIGRLSMGLLRPKHTGLGADLAGAVEAVGKNVTGLRPGDDVGPGGASPAGRGLLYRGGGRPSPPLRGGAP